MKIAHIDLGEQPLLLAPMEDVTDPAFRLMCKQFGADMVYTEFVSSEALVRNINRTLQKLTISEAERPVAIQIYGREAEPMVEAAKMVAEAKPDVIDLNFGCPVKKVAGKGAGAGMLQHPEKLLDITRQVVDAVDIPVTVKTRLGWNEETKIITTLAEQIQDCGAAALAIHGRTRSQMYTGKSDWTLIGEVKNNPRIHIPIIGNGDICSAMQAKEAFDKYGVDGIMVGRGTFGRPWIFEEIKQYLKTGTLPEVRPFRFYLDVLRQQVVNAIDLLDDERRGIVHTRRHLAATPLFKGINNFRQTRIAMLRAETKEDLFAILNTIDEQYGEVMMDRIAIPFGEE